MIFVRILEPEPVLMGGDDGRGEYDDDDTSRSRRGGGSDNLPSA